MVAANRKEIDLDLRPLEYVLLSVEYSQLAFIYTKSLLEAKNKILSLERFKI